MKQLLLYIERTKVIVDGMTDQQAGALFKRLLAYTAGNDQPTGDPLVDYAFGILKVDLDASQAKYDEICLKRSEAGKKHKGNQYTRQNGTNGTNVPNMEQTELNSNRNSIDVEIEIDNNKDCCCLPTSGRKQQQKPTFKEVQEECKKKGYILDSTQFYAYYEANGWLLKEGKPMRNWRAALYAWQKNAMKESATAPKTSAEVHDVTNQHLNKYNPSPNAISWDEFEKLNKS